MGKITTDSTRKIIDDFATEIDRTKIKGPNPTSEVIFFRRDHLDRNERQVWLVKTDFLRFRKDNGRIASEVASYEKLNSPLEEDDDEAQKILHKFLDEKDEAKTSELMKSLKHSGQNEPAIITNDGFLINGNRRKLALSKLFENTKDDKFKWMRVVILPGKDDPGGPPTLLEIEQVENRYQLQREGKAEYYNFDRALSMRRKIEIGMSLEEQLRDDPYYAALPEKEFQKEVAKVNKEYLEPLECVDEYLAATENDGLYSLISQGMSDREGRWQAFLDYNNHVARKLDNEKQRMQIGLDESEVGKAKDIAFKIIRQRVFPDVPKKLHQIMRDYTKLLADPDSKRELFALSHIPMEISGASNPKEKDQEWSVKNATEVIKHVKKAVQIAIYKSDKEEPITTLEKVLDSLQQDNLKAENLSLTDLPRARKVAEEIKDLADELKHEYWQLEKSHDPSNVRKKLEKKFKVK